MRNMSKEQKDQKPDDGPLRVSFDLDVEDARALRKVQGSYKDIEASVSQVAKMLLRLGLEKWDHNTK
jgi:hypothetical protein